MRRRVSIFSTIFVIFFTFSSLLSSPEIFAKSYSISKDVFTIEINADKSIDVTEELTYNFDGSFSWAEMNIPLTIERKGYSYRTSLENFSIEAKDGSPVSIETAYTSGEEFYAKWNYSALDEQKTFIIDYTVNKAVLKYTDVAELYWQVIGSGWDISHNNVTVTVILPESVASFDDLLVYGHGPLNGESKIVDGQTARFTADRVGAGQFMEIRTIFPSEQIDGSIDTSKTLTAIKSEEAQFVEETIAAAKREQRMGLIFAAFFFGWIPLSFIGWFFFWHRYWKKYGKEFEVVQTSEYMRELPSDLDPARVSVLMSQGSKPNINAFTATIFSLALKKVIKIEDEVELKTGLLSRKKEYHTSLILNPEVLANTKLNTYEQDLVTLLFETIGKAPAGLMESLFSNNKSQEDRTDNTVTMDEIKNWLKKNPQKFQRWFGYWQDKVKDETSKLQFMDLDSEDAFKKFWIFSALFAFTNPWILIPAAILNGKLKRWSQKWATEAKQWEAFKHFLDDFSHFKELPPESYKLWEFYLVFGILFGNAKEIIKMLPTILENPNAVAPTWYVMNNMAGIPGEGLATTAQSLGAFSESLNVFQSELQTASTSAAHYSSGGGGGFSGGGGGGGAG